MEDTNDTAYQDVGEEVLFTPITYQAQGEAHPTRGYNSQVNHSKHCQKNLHQSQIIAAAKFLKWLLLLFRYPFMITFCTDQASFLTLSSTPQVPLSPLSCDPPSSSFILPLPHSELPVPLIPPQPPLPLPQPQHTLVSLLFKLSTTQVAILLSPMTDIPTTPALIRGQTIQYKIYLEFPCLTSDLATSSLSLSTIPPGVPWWMVTKQSEINNCIIILWENFTVSQCQQYWASGCSAGIVWHCVCIWGNMPAVGGQMFPRFKKIWEYFKVKMTKLRKHYCWLLPDCVNPKTRCLLFGIHPDINRWHFICFWWKNSTTQFSINNIIHYNSFKIPYTMYPKIPRSRSAVHFKLKACF